MDEIVSGDLDRASRPSESPAQSSRRAKNAAHRANDVEFAFEIGSSLLTEVRRLQDLLGERDKAIESIEKERAELERNVNALKETVERQDAINSKFNEDDWKLKEENSNLTAQLEELRTQLADTDAERTRLDAEVGRIGKELGAARETGEEHKVESERLNVSLQDVLGKYHADVVHLKGEISDLQTSLDACRAEAVHNAATAVQAHEESASPEDKQNIPKVWRRWLKQLFLSNRRARNSSGNTHSTKAQ
ncbi:hypothetical protein BKA62DRAFT_674809 [Auriculariales sp. MPI-PUGE-AT-0066]|nr:hypothetical protein BKA62DRAFT_674809 [Auriculariales sp. MPI-PUGE-AT-0066]